MDQQFVMRLEWSDEAKGDLHDFFNYLESVAGERTAKKEVGKIYAHAQLLTRSPRIGQREPSFEDRPEDIRRLIEGSRKIIYVVGEDVVKIVTVFDCHRDPAELLKIVSVEKD